MTTDDRTPLMRELDALEIWEQHEPGPGFADGVLEARPLAAPRARVPLGVAVVTLAAVALVAVFAWWACRDAPIRAGSLVASARQSVALTDGTVIVAEPGTELRWAEREGAVVVEQQRGSAFYRVAAEHSAFSVRTPAGEVRVTGTCFSVDLAAEPVVQPVVHSGKTDAPMPHNRKALAVSATLAVAATVTVYEGRTVLANDAGSIRLDAGERGVAQAGAAPSRSSESAVAFADEAKGSSPTPAQELAVLRSHNRRQATELEQLRQRLDAVGAPPSQPEGTAPAQPSGKRNRFSGWGPPIPEGFDHYQPTQAALEEMAECGIVAWDQPPVWADDEQPDPQYLDALNLTDEERAAFEGTFDRFRSDTIDEARRFYVELGGDPAVAKVVDASELLGMVYGKTDLDTREESRIALAMERAGLAEAPSGEPPPSERFLRWDADLGNRFEGALRDEFGAERARELRDARGGWPGKRATWADLCSERK